MPPSASPSTVVSLPSAHESISKREVLPSVQPHQPAWRRNVARLMAAGALLLPATTSGAEPAGSAPPTRNTGTMTDPESGPVLQATQLQVITHWQRLEQQVQQAEQAILDKQRSVENQRLSVNIAVEHLHKAREQLEALEKDLIALHQSGVDILASRAAIDRIRPLLAAAIQEWTAARGTPDETPKEQALHALEKQLGDAQATFNAATTAQTALIARIINTHPVPPGADLSAALEKAKQNHAAMVIVAETAATQEQSKLAALERQLQQVRTDAERRQTDLGTYAPQATTALGTLEISRRIDALNTELRSGLAEITTGVERQARATEGLRTDVQGVTRAVTDQTDVIRGLRTDVQGVATQLGKLGPHLQNLFEQMVRVRRELSAEEQRKMDRVIVAVETLATRPTQLSPETLTEMEALLTRALRSAEGKVRHAPLMQRVWDPYQRCWYWVPQ